MGREERLEIPYELRNKHLRPTTTISTTSEETKASLPTFMKPLSAAPAITVTDTTSEATVLDDSSKDEYYEPQDYARGRSDRENWLANTCMIDEAGYANPQHWGMQRHDEY